MPRPRWGKRGAQHRQPRKRQKEKGRQEKEKEKERKEKGKSNFLKDFPTQPQLCFAGKAWQMNAAHVPGTAGNSKFIFHS